MAKYTNNVITEERFPSMGFRRWLLEGDEFTPAQEKFISDNSLMKIEINNVFSLTDEERQEEKDYISIMNETIDNYKKELYKK